jgi:hypothetical protein
MTGNNQGSADLLEFIQAGATVIAVFAGFAYVSFQRHLETAAAGRAAGHLAKHSIDFVAERLDALVDPSQPIDFALRGVRATEMIEVFRELEISLLPPAAIEPIAIIRSAVYAINCRIDEVLEDETRRLERRTRLLSAGRTLVKARKELERLQLCYLPWRRKALEAAPLSSRIAAFLEEAKR